MRDIHEAQFRFPSVRRRVLLGLAVVALAAGLPFAIPAVGRAASRLLAARQYRDSRAVAAAFAAAVRDRDVATIRRLARSGSDSVAMCVRDGWPEETWQFARPQPRVTFEGVLGDYIAYLAHSASERPGRPPVGLHMMLLRDDPTRVAVIAPRPYRRFTLPTTLSQCLSSGVQAPSSDRTLIYRRATT